MSRFAFVSTQRDRSSQRPAALALLWPSSPGLSLDPAARRVLEPCFGHDFSRVRIHTGEQAAENARSVGALAYTIGQDIIFGAGQYQPHSSSGQRLLAHELAHTVQQSGDAGPRDRPLRVEPAGGLAELEAESWADTSQPPRPLTPAAVGLALQRESGAGGTEEERQPAVRHSGASRRLNRPLVDLRSDVRPARIDISKGIDEITRDFYAIPLTLIPPNTPIPSGPILTLGNYGCSIRRYGLTTDEFSLSMHLDDADIRTSAHPFDLGGATAGMQTVQVWADHVLFRARLRQTIWLPNDVTTHPCLQGQDPARFRAETVAHERLHEADNVQAVQDTLRSLRARLAFTPGIGSLAAIVRITPDPSGFVRETTQRLRETLERLQQEFDLMYHRLSAEFASRLDPHDRELHELKQRLLEQARAHAAAQED
jgi:hypothetical protein